MDGQTMYLDRQLYISNIFFYPGYRNRYLHICDGLQNVRNIIGHLTNNLSIFSVRQTTNTCKMGRLVIKINICKY
jgi:hypothetical protein